MKISALKILRVQQGYKQSDLARMTGLTQARISHLENGLRPNPRDIAKLTEALGINVRAVEKEGQGAD